MTLAGKPIYAADMPPAVTANDATAISNISSTTFITDDGSAPVLDVDFIAPTSGRVVVSVGGAARGNAGAPAAPRVFLSFAVTSNAGTDTFSLAPNVERRAWSNSAGVNNFQYGTRSVLVEGLQPGGSYNCELQYRVGSGSSADIEYRSLVVNPAH